MQGVLDQLNAQPACVFTRMSGSGSACFAVFSDCVAADEARLTLSLLHPEYWIQTTALSCST